MFNNLTLFGIIFTLVKTVPNVKGYVIDCSEFCVLFRRTRSPIDEWEIEKNKRINKIKGL